VLVREGPQAWCQGGQGAVRREDDGEGGEAGEANRRAFDRPAGRQIRNVSLDRAPSPPLWTASSTRSGGFPPCDDPPRGAARPSSRCSTVDRCLLVR
jgi:hypothetical protein